MREWRKTSPRAKHRSAEVRRNDLARRVARYAIRCGKIPKGTACSQCGGTERLEMHHPDYTQPLAIVWLCRPHHLDATFGVRRPGRWKDGDGEEFRTTMADETTAVRQALHPLNAALFEDEETG